MALSEADKKFRKLNQREKTFCREYIYDWNGTRAYKAAYPQVSTDKVAAISAVRLLSKDKIQDYITEIQRDLSKLTGISRQMVVDEFRKIAFSNISKYHNTWITRVEFETISEADKACIQEISTKVEKRNIGTKDEPDIVNVEYVKLKLYDKQSALESINKMLGFNAPEKFEHTGKDGEPLMPKSPVPIVVMSPEEYAKLQTEEGK